MALPCATESALPQNARHLIEVLHYWAKKRPEANMLRFYPQGEVEEAFDERSFLTFYRHAEWIAESLAPFRGERALLFYQSGIDFLEALFACFIAGVTAVPAYPPRKNQNLSRIENLIDDCQPAIILASAEVHKKSSGLLKQQGNCDLNWLNTQTMIQQLGHIDDYQLPDTCSDIDPNNLAFLQYTSGSTGKPKGVMVSHHNLISNIRMAEANFKLPSDTRCVSWLPLFHDMGLIGAVMMPMYWGAASWLMPPAAFLQKPARWLALISRAGESSHVASAAPNFAYQMCIDQIDEKHYAELNLTQWIFALNGAEPIRAETVNNFIQKFSTLGFNESAMGPSYGMAECTLLASTRRQQSISQIKVDTIRLSEDSLHRCRDESECEAALSRQSILLNSSGSSCLEQNLCIVKEGQVQTDGSIGEIWLQGEHIAQGYWQQPALTQDTFAAFTDCGQGPFLRTGDRGALMHGELFITGRSKDMIVIRGKNIYPQDIEFTASYAHPALHHDSAAAFSISVSQQEELVLVQEIARHGRKGFDTEQTATAIRKAVAEAHGIELKHIAFINYASIAKTSSGKIQRHQCKALYLNQGLKLHAKWSTDSIQPLAKPILIKPLPALHDFLGNNQKTNGAALNQQILCDYLHSNIAQKLNLPLQGIITDAPLQSLGLDSIDMIQLASDIEVWGHCRLDHSLFFEAEHLLALSWALHAQIMRENQRSSDQPLDNQGDTEGFI